LYLNVEVGALSSIHHTGRAGGCPVLEGKSARWAPKRTMKQENEKFGEEMRQKAGCRLACA
jgi:hypothetical protein